MPKRINKDLNNRTLAEELWLWRKRHGLTWLEAATRVGVGCTLYSHMENGVHPLTPGAWKVLYDRRRQTTTAQGVPLDLLLARRRAGLGLEVIGRQLGVSRVTVLAWEHARDPRLVSFWIKKGFNLPEAYHPVKITA